MYDHYSKELVDLLAFLNAKMVSTHKKACDMAYWEIHEDLGLQVSALEEARRAIVEAADKIAELNTLTEKVTIKALKAKQGALVNWAKTQTLI